MPVSTPPPEALVEFLGPTTRHTRRVEIYESDGKTRWAKDTLPRLKDGSVSVDYDRDERRSVDLTFSNDDGVLMNAPGEFWYDKILKVYRGVQINSPVRLPRVLILSDSTTDPQAQSFRAALADIGFGDVQVNTLAVNYVIDVSAFDIIVALGDEDKGSLLNQAYLAGKSVYAFRRGAEFFLNAMLGSTTWGSETRTPTAQAIVPLLVSDPRTAAWTNFIPTYDASTTYKAPLKSIPQLFGVANAQGSTLSLSISSSENQVGGKFIGVHFPVNSQQYLDYNFKQFMLASMQWLNPVVPLVVWETQIGEFMIDRISEPHFPHEVKITGRDYTKKCMSSKFSEATQFDEGLSLEVLVSSLAYNAGIFKQLLPTTNIVIGQSFFFERATSRWDAMKQICTAYNYEIYFDATGYLVIRPFRDPSVSAPTLFIETGKQGQIASYTKSTSDASLFNHVLVSGESSDTQLIPVYAQVSNNDPNSPTSISKIGDRYWEYVSAFITTPQQAMDLAMSYLGVKSLEEFELSFETLILPWVEVGDIMGFKDPNPAPGDPNTFLLSTITLPLGLAPMSGVGRRVTSVGDVTTNFNNGAKWNSVSPSTTWNSVPDGLRWNDLT